MSADLVLVGGGGHCRSCIDVIEEVGEYRIAGIVDLPQKLGHEVLGYRVIASDEDWPSLLAKNHGFLITIGQIESSSLRRGIFERLGSLGAAFPVIVSPRAQVSRHADLGPGTMIMHHATVNAAARIGANCIVNTGAIVEHDAVIGDHCHVAPGAVVNGACRLGDDVFVGSQAVLFQGVTLTSGVVVSAGSTVRRSVTEPGVYRSRPS